MHSAYNTTLCEWLQSLTCVASSSQFLWLRLHLINCNLQGSVRFTGNLMMHSSAVCKLRKICFNGHDIFLKTCFYFYSFYFAEKRRPPSVAAFLFFHYSIFNNRILKSWCPVLFYIDLKNFSFSIFLHNRSISTLGSSEVVLLLCVFKIMKY